MRFGRKDTLDLWNSIPSGPHDDAAGSLASDFSRFKARVVSSSSQPVRTRSFRGLALASSTCASALAVLCIFLLLHGAPATVPEIEWQKVSAPVGQISELVLPDGTAITVNGGGSLLYPSEFAGSERSVFLDGEALFNVKSDPAHPFVIRTSGADVRVLGTRFNLCSYQVDPTVSLALYEGSVEFSYTDSMGAPAVCSVAPGERIVCDKAAGTVDKAAFVKDEFSTWTKRNYDFKGEPLGEIVRQMSRVYGLTFVIRDKSLENISYYMTLTDAWSADAFISLLEMDSRLKVVRAGDVVDIWSNRR